MRVSSIYSINPYLFSPWRSFVHQKLAGSTVSKFSHKKNMRNNQIVPKNTDFVYFLMILWKENRWWIFHLHNLEEMHTYSSLKSDLLGVSQLIFYFRMTQNVSKSNFIVHIFGPYFCVFLYIFTYIFLQLIVHNYSSSNYEYVFTYIAIAGTIITNNNHVLSCASLPGLWNICSLNMYCHGSRSVLSFPPNKMAYVGQLKRPDNIKIQIYDELWILIKLRILIIFFSNASIIHSLGANCGSLLRGHYREMISDKIVLICW